MIEITDRVKCSGCGACKDVCPKKAIILKADKEGFLYPHVNIVECIDCGKCIKCCPILTFENTKNEKNNNIAYAAISKSEDVRLNSSSGGVFTEIAIYILQNGGVVFGASFDENFNVKHIGIENIEQLDILRGSKYVQSKIGNTYVQAKEYLDIGRLVLFTGTPCQIAGLYSFLNKSYENLYTQDIICHGVPSPMFWGKYIEYREAKAGAKLQKALFRYKKYGWRKYSILLEFANGKKYNQVISNDLYMRGFLQNICLRPSCYDCSFKTMSRLSDITLADFWGVEKIMPQIDDNKGTSLVITHSTHGQQLLEQIRTHISYYETNLDEAIHYNSAMLKSASYNDKRNEILKIVSEKDFEEANKYLKVPLTHKIKANIKTIIKKVIRR